MAEVRSITRHQRRAWRQQRLAEARAAHRAALEAGLDYRGSGESGALVVHTHSLTWHRAKSPNITIPSPGRGWEKSGPVRVVEKPEERIARAVDHHQRGKRVADTTTVESTE